MDTLISSTNKSDHHDIAEILYKVALNTIALTPSCTELSVLTLLWFISRNSSDVSNNDEREAVSSEIGRKSKELLSTNSKHEPR